MAGAEWARVRVVTRSGEVRTVSWPERGGPYGSSEGLRFLLWLRCKINGGLMQWTVLPRGFHVLHVFFNCISSFNKLWESALWQTPNHWILLISYRSPFSTALCVIGEQTRVWESTKGTDTRGPDAGGGGATSLPASPRAFLALLCGLKIPTAGNGSGCLCCHLMEPCCGDKAVRQRQRSNRL